jgi:hypothetical protein
MNAERWWKEGAINGVVLPVFAKVEVDWSMYLFGATSTSHYELA